MNMNEVLIAKRSDLLFRVHAFLFCFLGVVALYCVYAYPEWYTQPNIIGFTQVVVVLVMGYRFGRLVQQPKDLVFAGDDCFIVHSTQKKEIRIPFADCIRIEGKSMMNKRTPYPFGTLWIQSKKESIHVHHVGKLKETLIQMRDVMGEHAAKCVFEMVDDENVYPVP